MSLKNILIMEAEYKLAQTPATAATKGERKILEGEIKRLSKSQPSMIDPNIENVYALGKYIFNNLI